MWCDLISTGKFQGKIWGQSETYWGGNSDQRDSYKVRESIKIFFFFLPWNIVCDQPSANVQILTSQLTHCALEHHAFVFTFSPQWQWGAGFHPEWQHGANLHPCEVWSRTHIHSVSSWTHCCSSAALLFKNGYNTCLYVHGEHLELS